MLSDILILSYYHLAPIPCVHTFEGYDDALLQTYWQKQIWIMSEFKLLLVFVTLVYKRDENTHI